MSRRLGGIKGNSAFIPHYNANGGFKALVLSELTGFLLEVSDVM